MNFFRSILKKRLFQKRKPILLFHHIAKNAGSSLRQILRLNYTDEELLEYYEEPETLDPVSWYRNAYMEMDKRNLKCLCGHTIHYLLPTLIQLNRPCKVFCILRHPVDRMLSLYHFVQGFVPEDGLGGVLAKSISDNNWQLEDIYRILGEGGENRSDTHFLFREFFNGQARTILMPHIPTIDFPFSDSLTTIPPVYRETLNTIIDRYYLLGTQEDYDLSVEYFAKQFGWHDVVYEKTNITESRPALDSVSPELVQMVERYNALDLELHRMAVERLQEFQSDRSMNPTRKSRGQTARC